MVGDILKSFLVGLGFEVDDKSLDRFNKSIVSATERVTGLSLAVDVSAAAVAYAITGISQDFEKMGYEMRIISPIINKTLLLRQELLQSYKAAGINIVEATRNAVKFNLSIEKTKFALEAIYKSVGSKFFTLLTKSSDTFRKNLYSNMPKILSTLEKIVKVLFKAFDIIVQFGSRAFQILGRLYDFFVILDRATDGWSTAIIAMIAAWRLLNLAFIATPLGMLLTGLTALVFLFDDFKTWKEGGQSFFGDYWKAALPAINSIVDTFTNLLQIIKGVFDFWKAIFHMDLSGVASSLRSVVQASGDIFYRSIGFKDAVGFEHFLKSQAQGVQNAVGLGGAQGVPSVTPVGPSVQGAQTNQHVQQQTTINVQGTADANSTAKSVAGEQGKVNYDMIQNLGPKTQ